MANNKSGGGCCSCLSGFICLVVIVIILVAAFFVSKYITVEQIGIADTPGILSRFDDSFAQDATLRSEGMENWKVYDVLMWIVKSGNYVPQN